MMMKMLPANISIFLMTVVFNLIAINAVGADEKKYPETLIRKDHYIDHISVEPFYARHNLDPKVVLHVREVVQANAIDTVKETGKVIVLVHGATLPGSVAFDLDFKNASLMSRLAQGGWDTFAIDLEGYGESSRPAIMDDPAAYPDEPAPISPDVTVADVATVVDYVRELRGVEKVHMLGWSAGAMIEVPRFAAEQPEKIKKIVLHGSRFMGKAFSKEEVAAKTADINAKKNRMGDPTSIERWGDQGTTPDMVIPGLFEVYTTAHLASDPMSAKLGNKVRAPFGRFIGVSTQQKRVNAEKITVPTLIIRGETDTVAPLKDNQALLAALASDEKKLVTIPGAGHWNQMEKTNTQFYKEIEDFLNN